MSLVFAVAAPTMRHVATAGADFTSTHLPSLHLYFRALDAAPAVVAKTKATEQAMTTTIRTECLLTTSAYISQFSWRNVAIQARSKGADTAPRTTSHEGLL